MKARVIGGTLWVLGALGATNATFAGELGTLEQEYKQRCKAMLTEKVKGTNDCVLGQEGWIVLTSELAYARLGRFWDTDPATMSPKADPSIVDPVTAIADFDRQLKARGIWLIFMPVPTRPVIYPEAILGREKLKDFKGTLHLHSPQDEFYKVLRSKGVEVLDLTPHFLAAKSGEYGGVFTPSDSHWTPRGISVAVDQLAKALSKEKWLKSVPKQEFVIPGWSSRTWWGGIYKAIVEKGGQPTRPPDTVWLPTVRLKTPDGSKRIEFRNPESPIIIIGDSNTFWWKDQDAAFSQQLAGRMGFLVDLLSTADGGATNTRLNLVRTIHASPGYADNKKVVIWCFTSRAFGEQTGGWRLIPLDQAPPPEPTPKPKAG